MTPTEPLLRLEKVTKRFAHLTAVDGVDLVVHPHEVVGLIGENGAGKSTLFRILGGTYTADEGQVVLRGTPVRFRSPGEAAAAGVGIVYQEQSILGSLTVAENILLGCEGAGVRMGFYRRRRMLATAKVALDKIGAAINPAARCDTLTFGECQMVELAKALAVEERSKAMPLILLDEPTSVLDKPEIALLFRQIARLREVASVIFVSHRMEEVLEVSSRIYVLRQGACVAERDPSNVSRDELYELMSGEAARSRSERAAATATTTTRSTVLRARGISVGGKFAEMDLDVKAGEVVGLAGVHGSGCDVLCRALFGAERLSSGSVELNGVALDLSGPPAATRSGIAYVPAERRTEGIVADMSVMDNLVLTRVTTGQAGLVRDRKVERGLIDEWIERMDVRAPGPTAPMTTLSGGNQQKIALAKWLMDPRLSLLLLDHPTRGLDARTRVEVFGVIARLAARGVAVVLLADTLEELIDNSDRILTMRDGAITGEFAVGPDAAPSTSQLLERMV